MHVIVAILTVVVGYFTLDALLAYFWGRYGHDAQRISFFTNRPLRRRFPKFFPKNSKFLFWLAVLLGWLGVMGALGLTQYGVPLWLAGILGGFFCRLFVMLGEISDRMSNPQRYKPTP